MANAHIAYNTLEDELFFQPMAVADCLYDTHSVLGLTTSNAVLSETAVKLALLKPAGIMAHRTISFGCVVLTCMLRVPEDQLVPVVLLPPSSGEIVSAPLTSTA